MMFFSDTVQVEILARVKFSILNLVLNFSESQAILYIYIIEIMSKAIVMWSIHKFSELKEPRK